MGAMTVRELRDALANLYEQDAPVIAWTSNAGEVVPRVIDTGDARVLAVSWDRLRKVYIVHMCEDIGHK